MSRQNYTAWFTAYPKTHVLRGQTVEVVTKDSASRMYEAMVRERGMLRRALGEYENDQQIAARYEEFGTLPSFP